MPSVPRCCANKCRCSRCGSCDEEVDVNMIGYYECEIWIYTKSLPIFTSARDKFKNSAGYENMENSVMNLSVPIFEDWMLVSKFHGSTLWMKASERDGVLQTDILDSEPQDIENRISIGVVKISIPKMMKLFNKSKLAGEKYSLCGANSQSLIKDVLKELGIGKEHKTINDIIDLILLEEVERERDSQINDATTFHNEANSANDEKKIKPQIWIYTRRLESSPPVSMIVDKKKKSLINKALIPVLKHWILVIKFRSTTFWVEANSYNRFLYSRFLEKEPDEVEDRRFLGSVNMSVNQMIELYDRVERNFGGSKYHLAGSNCQSWILAFLNDLGIGNNITIINYVVKTTGIAALLLAVLCVVLLL